MEKFYDVRVLAPIVGTVIAWCLVTAGLYHSIGYMTLTGQYGQTRWTELWYIGLLGVSYIGASIMLMHNWHCMASKSGDRSAAFLYAAALTLIATWDIDHGGSGHLGFVYLALDTIAMLTVLRPLGLFISDLESRIEAYAI